MSASPSSPSGEVARVKTFFIERPRASAFPFVARPFASWLRCRSSTVRAGLSSLDRALRVDSLPWVICWVTQPPTARDNPRKHGETELAHTRGFESRRTLRIGYPLYARSSGGFRAHDDAA